VKPISLQLAWFGPYTGDATTIVFDQLDALFLISGETGAGKTSLFDAMCFALYGKPLGTRNAKTVRSQVATDADSTVVELEFECAGARWKVVRSPHFARPKKKGAGFVAEEVTTLQRRALGDDSAPWESITGRPSELTARIESEILRLSHAEFSKILVLPQGEFQRFLEMETSERGALLAKLFPTELHKEIARLAKLDAAELEAKLLDLEVRLREVERDYDPKSHADDAQRLRTAVDVDHAASVLAARAHAEALRAHEDAKRLAAQLVKRTALEQQRDTLDVDHPRIEALEHELHASRRAQRVVPRLDERAQLLHELARKSEERDVVTTVRATLTADEQALAPALAGVGAREAQVTADIEQAAHAQQHLDDVQDLTGARDAVATLQAKLVADSAKLQPLVHDEQQAELALQALAPLAEQREHVLVRINDAQARTQALAAHESDVALLRAWPTLHVQLVQALHDAHGVVADVDSRRSAAEDALNLAQRRRDAELARVLATTLHDGEPCPVCGSSDHPHPARGDVHDDVQARLKSAEQALAARRGELDQAKQVVTAKQSLLDVHTAQATGAHTRLAAAGFVDLESFDRARVDATHALTTSKQEDQRLGALLAARKALELARDAKRTARETTEKDVQATREKLAGATSVADALDAKLGGGIDVVAALRDGQVAVAQRRNAIAAEQRALAELRARGEAMAKARALQTQRHEQLTADLTAGQERLHVLEDEVTRALQAQEFADADAARLAVRDAKRQALCEHEVTTWRNAQLTVRGQLAALVADTEGKTAPDLDALAAAELTSSALAHEAAQRDAQAAEVLARFVERAQRHAALLAEAAVERGKGEALVVLARDLNGDNTRRIDFSTYVLSWWLARVLEHATSHFERLSDHRYAFRLNDDGGDKRKKLGLDIDVYDAHNGGNRAVGSLSGGEKFLASLSLALGLSDAIVAQSGGIELDTLFIDEGFGSLDPTTLDRAITVLDAIGAHRRVGIISHVEALQKAVPCQVRVTKGPSGSRVTVSST
jgi:exonuclease SbcC